MLVKLLEALDILIKPVAESGISDVHTTEKEALLRTLQANIVLLGERLRSDPACQELGRLRSQVTEEASWCESSQDVTWNFVLECLVLLQSLKRCLTKLLESFNPTKPNSRTPEAAPPLPPDVLSIAQQKTVCCALQFVVTLGICPYLLPGVGVPLSRRSAFGAAVESALQRDVPPDGTRRLFVSCTALLEVAELCSLGTMLFTRHLGDILAGLCQLGYCPSRSKAELAVVTEQGKGVSMEERRNCKRALQGLLGKVYQPIIIKELLILQGGPKQAKQSPGGVSKQALAQAPAWLRRLCGQLLSERLMQPSGVQAIVRGILEGAGELYLFSSSTAGSDGGREADWRKCDTVARILSTCPQQSLSADEYYRLVCPQVLELLHMQAKLTALQFQRVATTTVLTMVQEQPQLAEKYLLAHLLNPLVSCLSLTDNNCGTPVVEESDLTRCIEDIYKVCVVGNRPLPALMMSLGSVIPVIFSLYCFTKQNASHLRSPCHEILLWYFSKTTDSVVAISSLKQLSGLNRQPGNEPPLYQFSPGSEGGAVVGLREPICDEDEALYEKVSSEQWRVECFVDLLASLQDSSLPGDYFIELLKELTTWVEEEEEEAASTLNMSLLELEQYQEQQTAKQEQKLLILQVLAVMCERLSHTLLRNPIQVVEFIAAMLQRVCACLDREIEGTVETQSLSMAMGLVATMLAGAATLESEDYAAMKVLLPLLHHVSQQHPEPVVQELAADLRATIATHGAFSTEAVLRAAQSASGSTAGIAADRGGRRDRPPAGGREADTVTRSRAQGCSVVTTEVEESPAGEKSPTDGGRITGTEGGTAQHDRLPSDPAGQRGSRISRSDTAPLQPSKPFSECLLEAFDPDVPTRALALRTLARMIQDRDSQALGFQDKILTVFLENLEHEDSFLYLSAIQGLTVLADVFPDQILQRLLDEYRESPPEVKKHRSLETRLKVGEVLMRASRALGDLTCHYAGPLIHVFLRATRDEDSSIRASSLSNLGELSQRLNFALGPLVHELCSCLTAIIRTDGEAEVRRAGVHVIALLLRGLSNRATEVLKDVLRDLYRTLKFVVQNDRDEVAVLHAQLALEELDDVMRRFIFPEQKLEKKIVVLP
ncbi:transport and Golgi organization protein 6 homolog isoform X2 [Lepisosteus oculatus]|uniref:transport and Golgi organization protein 6 homolog isoform X2 n=1 Tax=Lepisosteus oculatus TaxID=7918 RepID=UPI0035F5259A